MIVLMGKGGSGKDAIAKELIKKGFTKAVTYTTRPPRVDEINGIEYWFISEDEFKEKIDNGFFAEYQTFNRVDGTYLYGSAKCDYIGDKIIILTPAGLRDVIKLAIPNTVSFLIECDEKTLGKRMTKRKDDVCEIKRRLLSDKVDFTGIGEIVDYTIYNGAEDNIVRPIDIIADIIQAAYFSRREENNGNI